MAPYMAPETAAALAVLVSTRNLAAAASRLAGHAAVSRLGRGRGSTLAAAAARRRIMKEYATIVGRRLLVAAALLTPLLWLTLPARRLGQLPQRALIAGAAGALIATAVLGLRRARWTRDVPFLCILLVAGLARLWLATTERYVHDEINTAIPLARTISFQPGQVHLPLRGENHPALPAYVVKASGEFFGRNPAGYRMLSLLLGLGVLVLIYSLSVDALGPIAARWAAALLAFNEYLPGGLGACHRARPASAARDGGDVCLRTLPADTAAGVHLCRGGIGRPGFLCEGTLGAGHADLLSRAADQRPAPMAPHAPSVPGVDAVRGLHLARSVPGTPRRESRGW